MTSTRHQTRVMSKAFDLEKRIGALKDELHKHLLDDPNATHWTCCGCQYAPTLVGVPR